MPEYYINTADPTKHTPGAWIDGWMMDAELEWLHETAKRMASIAEIGCWKGRSTYALAAGCTGPVYAIDHWRGSPRELGTGAHSEAARVDLFQVFAANTKDLPNIVVVRKPSLDAAPFVPEIDMVFIDGDHDYEAVAADLKAWTPKTRQLICGHDFDAPGVDRAVMERFPQATRACNSIWAVEL